MIQFYADLKDQLLRLDQKNIFGGQIQKIYSTAFYIAISIRTPGKTLWLYIGRGNGYEGVWLSDAPPVSALRRRDHFLEYLRKFLISTTLVKLNLDVLDRIISIEYQKYGQINSLFMFWMGRKTYIAHYYFDFESEQFKLLLSWDGKTRPTDLGLNDVFERFNFVGRSKNLDIGVKNKKNFEIEELLKNELVLLNSTPQKTRMNFLDRKELRIREDLLKAEEWISIKKFLDEGHDLSFSELTIGSHVFKFENEINEFERRNKLFEKIKKLKKGEQILNQRLKEVLEIKSNTKINPRQETELQMIKPVWGKSTDRLKKSDQNLKEENLEFKIFDFDDYYIGVGLNAKGNDQLRNKWASKEDYWFHLDGLNSSHAILKLKGKSLIQTELVNFISSIVAYFSRYSSEWIPIVYTQIKNLKGVPGVQGMVTFKKEKRLSCQRVNIDFLIKDKQ